MIPLAVRSHFSLLRGVGSPEALCRAARRLGYARVALTDTDNLYGLPGFLKAAQREGVGAIVGAEVTDLNSAARAICLVETEEGYRNLCRLLTARRMAETLDAPHATEEAAPAPIFEAALRPYRHAAGFDLRHEVSTHAAGLTVLTDVPALLEAWHAAGVCVAGLLGRRPSGPYLKLRDSARCLGVPLAAAPDSFFPAPADARVHRVLRAIARNSSLSRLEASDLAPDDAWLAGPDEYRRRFAVCPEAVRATEELAERCVYAGPSPRAVFPRWHDPLDRPAAEALREEAYAGARRRYGDGLPEAVVDRLEHELRRIADKGFADYFLVVRRIVLRSPRICGRGSGAASIVAYCLGITNVCPIKFNLYFERFLNPGRADPPDIDVDFAWDERDGVLDAVLADHAGYAAMVCNHVLFQPRMALREVAKVYGLPAGEIDRVVKRLPWFWTGRGFGDDADAAGGMQEALQALPELRGVEFPAPWPEIVALAQRIVGAPRNLSVHPGGVVVTPRPVREYVPIERAAKGVPVVQWEKDGAEERGLVKIDLLGNRSLAVIRDALANLRANGTPLDEARWEPEDDPATQEAVARGRTMGCFYIESPAMRLLQERTGRGDYEHLVIHSSLIRPAANEFIREYIRRLRGGAWEPLHPLLAEVLDETYGIMVYQEDVSRTAEALAGFDCTEADRLRKVMSKKDKEHELADYRRRFFEGAASRGVGEKCIERVWAMIMSFDGYSFCKPHSASYARVSFQAAYLKVHHPAEFMAAVISNQGGFYSAFAYVSEARRMGVTVLPPDVNVSDIRWTGRGRDARVGFLSLKDLGEAASRRMLEARAARPFSSLHDLLERARPDEAEVRALIHAGACDSLAPGRDRVELLWELAAWRRRRMAAASAPPSLFGAPEETRAPRLAPTAELERLRREFQVLGFLRDRHPMELYRDTWAEADRVRADAIVAHVGRRVRFAGWLVTGKVVHTKQGDPMEFLTFEDETGLVETTFFPRAYARYCDLLGHGGPFMLEGRVEEDFGVCTLTVDRVARLEALRGSSYKPSSSTSSRLKSSGKA